VLQLSFELIFVTYRIIQQQNCLMAIEHDMPAVHSRANADEMGRIIWFSSCEALQSALPDPGNFRVSAMLVQIILISAYCKDSLSMMPGNLQRSGLVSSQISKTARALASLERFL